jgi:hypothetical protein
MGGKHFPLKIVFLRDSLEKATFILYDVYTHSFLTHLKTYHRTSFLQPRKTADFRHCEEGRSPDEAIQKANQRLDCFNPFGVSQ